MQFPPPNGRLLTTAVWAVLVIQGLTWAGILETPTLRQQQDAAQLRDVVQQATAQQTAQVLTEQRVRTIEHALTKLEGQIEQMVMLLHALDVRTAQMSRQVGAGGTGGTEGAP